jgi:ATP/maltotriose-dependent transcriptional regulator MalT
VTQDAATAGASRVPRSVGEAAEAVLAVRGQASKVRRVIDRSPVPAVLVDNQRRYVEVNRPARLAFRLSLAEMRTLAIDDLTPPSELATLEGFWERLLRTGCVAGPLEVASPNGDSRFGVIWSAIANILPGHHAIVFSLAGLPDDELDRLDDDHHPDPPAPLTPRERELLQLAAAGLSGPRIAEELVLSRGTVRTHFNNIYTKLGVRDRAGAVAMAMRLGLIE